jgi:iron complex outermembrane receptor protein
MKISIMALAMVLSYYMAVGQQQISGKVFNENHESLPGASIYLPDLNKGGIADVNGSFIISNLPSGRFRIQCSYLGYTTEIMTVNLSDKKNTQDFILKKGIIESQEIVISGGFDATQHENAVKIEKLPIGIFSVKSSPNFTEMLTKVPGVDMISKGSGIGKPVIRGLSMNDILTLNNGVRIENYPYSSHHPLGIDEFGIDEVEVIKGPASLIYGSDAIGGVINFLKEKPAPSGTVSGDFNTQLFSNSLGMTNNLGIKGASKKISWGIRAGQKLNADFLQGGGEYAPNSRFQSKSMMANIGVNNKTGSFRLNYDYSKAKIGLVEEEAIEMIKERGRTPEIFYQQFNSHMLSSQNKIFLGNKKLEMNASFQSTDLMHLGEPDQIELQMRLKTVLYESKLHLPGKKSNEYIIGFQGFNQINSNLNKRETILLPDAFINNYSIFGMAQHNVANKVKLQAGLRYDFRQIETKATGIPDSSAYRPALSKQYHSLSGSLGSTWNINENLLLRLNLASAYRTPNLAELTSNGPHETRFELGDSNLIPEKSLEADISSHYHIENMTFDIALFYNYIHNFIFISPIGEHSPDGLPIYQYKQMNARLVGGEAGIHFHPASSKWLHFYSSVSNVEGILENDDYLPFIPATKINFEVKFTKSRIGIFKESFVAIKSSTSTNQHHPAPDEIASDAYSLIDLSFGTGISVRNQEIQIGTGINNLFDTKYSDHLSTLKEAGLFEPGRNIYLSIRIPFGLKNVKSNQ